MATVRFSFASSNKRNNYNAAMGGRGGKRSHDRIPTVCPRGTRKTHTHTSLQHGAEHLPTSYFKGAFLKKESGVQSKAQHPVKEHPYYCPVLQTTAASAISTPYVKY